VPQPLLLAVFTLLFSALLTGQTDRPDFIYGGQLNIVLPGLTAYAELPVRGRLVLRPEISMNLGYARNTFFSNAPVESFAFTPAATLGGRYYYNYRRRADQGKRVYRNSASFVSLRAGYWPGLGVNLSDTPVSYTEGFTLIPTYGIRRSLGRIQWECFAGLGYRYTGLEGENKTSGAGIDLRLAVGF
jgi:hypothetical protein